MFKENSIENYKGFKMGQVYKIEGSDDLYVKCSHGDKEYFIKMSKDATGAQILEETINQDIVQNLQAAEDIGEVMNRNIERAAKRAVEKTDQAESWAA